ncbi:MAG TPA: RNA polymerase sigma factor [Pyrinomonadaceae bacterium]
MLRPAPVPGSHDDLFMARYQRLAGWALRLTEGDHHAAEDLVHDAFIQFTLKQPNLAVIENLDDYLYVMLRNLHISQARRASQTPTIQLAISDYDTAEIGLRLIDAQRQLQARDDLRSICGYVNQRKETSKAASVLILRFFHTYFPAEIASILRTSRQAVEIWLLNARRESRLYLEDPTALHLIGKQAAAKTVVRLPQRPMAVRSADIFRELCETIFASRQGECLNKDQLRALYEGEETIECERLAHTVSCPECLETVNQLLGLTSLDERYRMESPDTDKPPSGQGGPPATSGGNGGVGEIGRRLRRRRRDTIEHRPHELRIAVNGFFVSRQKVGMPVNELALKLNLEEKISFIEVFSEQGLLLSHFTVTPPTDGEIEQREAVEFGEGRALETTVSFNTQWPTLHVVYRDPLVAYLQNALVEGGLDPSSAAFDSQDGETRVVEAGPDSLVSEPHRRSPDSQRGLGLQNLGQQWRNIFRLQFWLRPGAITAVFALLLLATVVIVMRRHQPAVPVTAADLIQRATTAEEIAAANTSTATHRTLQIEERRGSLDGEVIARRRVELWQSAARGVTVRRVYDDRGQLLAGEWTRADNVTTLYHHGARPQLRPSSPTRSSLNLDNVWQLSPSAKDFTQLVGEVQSVRLEERTNHYVLSFDNAGDASPYKLVQTRLILGREDLHAVEQSLLVQQDNEIRAYRIIETSFERRPNDAVAPAMFEPESELLSSTEPELRNPKAETSASAPDPRTPAPVMATAALEVEVLQLLNQANAFMGEQVTVTRTPEGRLLVSGLVETEERKSELLGALASVRNNSAVKIDVETVSTAAQRERPKSPGNVTVDRVEAIEGTSPLYAELKKKFPEDEARRYADRVMVRSRQARRHALAMKQLTQRFSLSDLRTLPEADRARWIGLLQEHARAFQVELQALQRELQQVFPALSEPGAVATGSIGGDADIQEAVRRLYDFSVSVDEDVRQSFALSVQGNTAAQVKTGHFWQSLKSAEGLAARIRAAH